MVRKEPEPLDRGRRPMSPCAVRGLEVRFRTAGGIVRAVNGMSFDVHRGETLAIVGESGSGKSATALADPAAAARCRRRSSRASASLFEGRDLLALSEPAMRAIRGNAISMIFQEPMTSLDPVMTVGARSRK